MENHQLRMIIDCDAGHDDVESIMVALSQPDVEVLAITCVSGTTNVDNVCRNVLRTLKICDREKIPVYKGCFTSLIGGSTTLESDHIHGFDGLGDIPQYVLPDMTLLSSEHAVNALVRLINQHAGEIHLVATGPLTNVAMAMRMDPGFTEKLKSLTVMGGNIYGRGNITLCGEFNFAMDPEAAYIVLNSCQCLMTLLTSEICEEHFLTFQWFEDRATIGTEKAKFVTDTAWKLKKYFEERFSPGKTCPYFSWDSLAMIATVRKESVLESGKYFATVELAGNVTRGQMVVDWSNKLGKYPNVNIVKKMDMKIVEEIMTHSVE
ncbi:nucleoside hydrolase-like [Saccoglossus kowalevskii]|uniref:Inosine-uridine preferring nucleoside hydrolase-like n=1 Tax=Saccoglossus kowalevskii TaxID=10224 RepID=A0ABM0MHX4_SACKO|nr:PREDICTED: inosine-uridine preferring nucleoside hydrolase-like [Saccoglossus kowalevskii]